MTKLPDYLNPAQISAKSDTAKGQAKDYVIDVNSISEHNPVAPSSGNNLAIRLNDYQRDIYTKAAARSGMSVSAFLRFAGLEIARKQGVF